MNNYFFTFKQSGKGSDGKAFQDNNTYSINVKASTQAIAEKRLRSRFYKSVIITIVSTTATAQ